MGRSSRSHLLQPTISIRWIEQVDPDDVQIGTVIVVQPGEKVPIDGKVVEGSSSLNTSALTGESVPREVHVGDEIISGCVNLNGLIKIGQQISWIFLWK